MAIVLSEQLVADIGSRISASQAARLLEVTDRQVRYWATEGVLQNVLYTVNGQLFDKEEVDALASARQARAR